MAHAAGVASTQSASIPVIDFRRQRMMLEWHTPGGTWTACDVPPAQVHGIALIRAAQPNICVYGHAGQLFLQVGPDPYALSEDSPRLRCTRGIASFGLRRRFTVQSISGSVLFSHAYWSQGADFFFWLAARARDPVWRTTTGLRWSQGVDAAAVRSA